MDIKDSDSDVSDGWSVVDAATQSEDGSLKDESDDESIHSTASDGESLEIIQEENEERKQVIESVSDAENDCCSAIGNCGNMMEEAASDSIEWNGSKLQTYVHHRNCHLNARLNFVMMIAVAAVAGLGVGHFIGSQEDCQSLPNNMPDISMDSIDNIIHENPGGNFDPYFRQSLISHVLKAKRIKQVQQRYRMFEDSFCAVEDKVKPAECFSKEQKSENNKFLDQNINIDVGVKDFTGKHHQDSEDAASMELHNTHEELKQESLNNIHNINSKDIAGLGQHEHVHQDSDKVSEDEAVKLEHIQESTMNIQGTGVWQKEIVYKDSRGSSKEEKIELKHSLGQEIVNDYSQIRPVPNPEALDVNRDSNLPSKVVFPKELEKGIPAEEAKSCQQGLFKTFDEEIHLDDVVDNAYVEISPDHEPSFGNVKKTKVDDVDAGDSNTYEEDIQQQDSRGIRDDTSSESEKQTAEQLPWLKRFSDTIQTMRLPRESKLFGIVDLLASLKQSIVELDETIVSNESSKFLKKMKMSANKMKETMERIQKDTSSWSLKTAEKMHHRLSKLKSKVQEKWCDIKDRYQQQNANIFGWLENNIFQNCQTNDGTYHMESAHDKRGSAYFVTENDMKHTHKSDGKTSENKMKHTHKSDGKTSENKMQENNSFDKKGDDDKAKHENRKGNPHKFKATGNFGYARNGPNSASHDFGKSSKGAFDKLRQNSMKCPPHCKHGNGESNHMDSKEKWMLARKVAADWKDSNNISGIWMLRMSQGREESRRNDQKSDWLFERAKARKLRRDTDHEQANWYFDRAEKRENRRVNPQSDWCLGAKSSVQEPNKYSYDHFDSDDDDDEEDDDDDDRQDEYFRPKFWSKKIPSAPFAKTGKWLKNTVKDFKQKMNYYQYNQHKFHYV